MHTCEMVKGRKKNERKMNRNLMASLYKQDKEQETWVSALTWLFTAYKMLPDTSLLLSSVSLSGK